MHVKIVAVNYGRMMFIRIIVILALSDDAVRADNVSSMIPGISDLMHYYCNSIDLATEVQ